MKTRIQKLIVRLLALCALLGATARVNAQVSLTVDPNQPWIGYMNIFSLPVNGGGYLYGSVWGTADLRGAFVGATNLVLQPCTNVWDPSNPFWVQGDGVTPNTMMDANFYVEDNTLANTNVVFTGKCLSNTLTASPEPLTGVSYTSVAFIKNFDASYNLLSSATSNLVAGQSFSLSLNTVGATHVQYGFETVGPDASPASALGNVVVAVQPPSVTVSVDPTQAWQGFMNVFNLPADGNGYQFGSSWGLSDLRAIFSGTTNLTLLPCINVWETSDTYWVKPDGITPNKLMDASVYVQKDALTNTNVVFIGTTLTNTLTSAPEPLTGVTYTSVAFIKAFNSSFSTVLASVTVPLVPGQSFGISLNTAGAAHVQYGFETIGPDANPATVSSLGNVVLAAGIPPSPAPVPTNNAPTPTRPAGSVYAMYNSSGTYVNHPPERWRAAWSSTAQGSYTIAPTGNVVLKYSNLQYAGVEFYNNDPVLGAGGDNVGGPTNFAINAIPYDTFHVDIWTPDANQFGIQLVSIYPATEGPQVDFLPAGGKITTNGWVSLDIPLSTFSTINSNVDFSNLQQMLWIDNQAGGGVTGGIFYIDNVYFYNAPRINVSLSGGSAQLSFTTINGSNYDIQFKTNLTDAVWQTLSTTPGDGTAHMVPDTASHNSRFYRLYVH